MPINDPKRRPRVENLPQRIREAFRDRATIPLPELAGLMQMDKKTLSTQVKVRRLPYRQKGVGRKKPRRVFTIDDAAAVWHSMSANWQT